MSPSTASHLSSLITWFSGIRLPWNLCALFSFLIASFRFLVLVFRSESTTSHDFGQSYSFSILICWNQRRSESLSCVHSLLLLTSWIFVARTAAIDETFGITFRIDRRNFLRQDWDLGGSESSSSHILPSKQHENLIPQVILLRFLWHWFSPISSFLSYFPSPYSWFKSILSLLRFSAIAFLSSVCFVCSQHKKRSTLFEEKGNNLQTHPHPLLLFSFLSRRC